MTDDLFSWPFKTPIGWCVAVGSAKGLESLTIGLKKRRDFEKGLKGPAGKGRPAWVDRLESDLDDYFSGDRPAFDVPLALDGVSAFYRGVYAAAQSIPYGEVRSYGWLAEKAGSPGAARAVGGAMAANPVPLIVPCHRVVRSDGHLGGFSAEGGTSLKRRLLALEGLEGATTIPA